MCRSTTFCQIPYTSLDLQKWQVLLCSHSMQSLMHTWKSFFVNKYLNFTSRAEVLHPSSFTKRDSKKMQDRIKERILKLVFFILWNQGLSVTLTTRETCNLSITIYKVNVYPVCACHHGISRGTYGMDFLQDQRKSRPPHVFILLRYKPGSCFQQAVCISGSC